jgi:ketosteroid isomerase-like protein
MSAENVEVVRRFADHWVRGEWAGLEDLVDPEVEQHSTIGGLEQGRVLHGLAEIRRDYESVEESWDEHRMEVDDVIDAGDRVVLLHREYQRGRGSGVELQIEAAVIFDLRDGRIVRIQGYLERGAALQAVRLD